MKISSAKLKFYTFIFLVIVIILISLLFHAKGYHFLFYKDLGQISSNSFFPIIYLLLYCVSFFFPLPFLAFLGGAIFPFYEALILSIFGNILSFIIMFYMTRWLGRDYVEIYEKDHTKLKKLDLNVDKNAFLYVFLLRLLFIIPPRIVNLAAGLSKMRFKEYILPSTLGAIPVLFISILLIKSYQLKEFHLFILSLISFVLLIFLSYLLIKKFRKDYKKK